MNASLEKGLNAINARSKGLYNFTQSYRKLTGIPKVTLKNTTTRQIILRVATLMENSIRERNISMRTSTIEHAITVDTDLMEQVLINLVLNAVDAVTHTTDPFIEIGSKRNAKGEVIIFVRDNGEGIDETTGEKIFIPFFSTRKTGSGIGLALAKQILQLHHADISFISEPGKGTEFIIRL